MKNRREQIKDFFKGVFLGIFAITLLVMVVGCDKKKGSSRGGDPYYWRNPGYGGPGYGGNGVAQIGMGIEAGTGSNLILAVSQDPNGQAFIEGELEITQNMPCGMYGIPAGIYRLFPDGPGSYVNGMFSGSFEGDGREFLYVRIPFGRYFSTNVCGYQGISASVEIYTDWGYCGTKWFSDQGNLCR